MHCTAGKLSGRWGDASGVLACIMASQSVRDSAYAVVLLHVTDCKVHCTHDGPGVMQLNGEPGSSVG